MYCTARAGASTGSGAHRHVLRNSSPDRLTLFGLGFGAVVGGGAILTETVFSINDCRAHRLNPNPGDHGYYRR